jgi:hypothetical protein
MPTPGIHYIVREVFDGREGELNGDLERSYTRTFLVDSPFQNDDPMNIAIQTGIPRVWDPYITPRGIDMRAWCISSRPALEKGPYLWKVTSRYSSKPPAGSRPDQADPNPLLRPAIIKWATQTVQQAMEVTFDPLDFAADPDILTANSAGDMYDPLPEIAARNLVLTVEKNQATYDEQKALDYIDTMNDADWWGGKFHVWQARVDDINGSDVFEGGMIYWKVQYVIHIRPSGYVWTLSLVDIGGRELVGGVMKEIISNRGNPIQALLNGAGLKQAPPFDPVYNTFFPYRERDFGALGLP